MRDGSVERERLAIDEAVAGRTLCDLLDFDAEHDADRPAQLWREGETWRQRTWREVRTLVAEVAMGLADLGIERGDVVAIMASNRPEHVVADLGALYAAATPVTLYGTLAVSQIAFVAGDCKAKVAVLEDREVLARWLEVKERLPDLRFFVLLEADEEALARDDVLGWDDLVARGRAALAGDPAGFEARRRSLEPEDPATIIYTSGTTGRPKGVVVTNRNVLWMLESSRQVKDFRRGTTAVSYLPLAHIAERMFTHYSALKYASSIYFCPETSKAIEYVREARPAAFLAVPRVWEKMNAALVGRVQQEKGAKGRLALAALKAGREVARRERLGQAVPTALRLRHRLLDRLVLSKIRRQIGLDRCEFAVSGAAPIPLDVLEFFAGLGILVHEVYGMTESTALITANREGRVRLGTVGEPMPGVEVRVAEDGEILARGGNVTAGYLGRPAETAETYADGWLHTGDLGALDAQGYLRITGRKKELIVTSSGKNISPAAIEQLLVAHPLVGQVCVVGDGRPYVTALVVLDPEVAPGWARGRGLSFRDLSDLASDDAIEREIRAAVDAANAQLSRIEQIKRFTIVPSEWTPENEALTPTMKLKRHVILERHAGEIDGLYA